MKYILILLLITASLQAQRYKRLDKEVKGEAVEVFNTLVFCDKDTLTVEPLNRAILISDGVFATTSITVNTVQINYKYLGTLVNCYNFQDSTRTIHIIGVTTPQPFYNSYKIY